MARDRHSFSVRAGIAHTALLISILLCGLAPGAFAEEVSVEARPPNGLSGWGEARASAAIPPLLAQAEDEPVEEDFVACAVICQRRLDKQILNCSGYKNRGAEGSRAPMPAASCRDDAHAAYKSCRSACDERWPGNREKYPS